MVNIIIGVVQVKVIRIGSEYFSRIKRIVQPGKLQEPSRVGIFGKFKLIGQRKGRMNTTRRGFNCQNWQKNYPHEVKIKPINADHNYCRNPEGDPRGPWCYTTSEVKWDYCFIPQCECVHTCLPDKAGFNHIAYLKAFIV